MCKIRQIKAFEATDGKVFKDYDKAKEYQVNLDRIVDEQYVLDSLSDRLKEIAVKDFEDLYLAVSIEDAGEPQAYFHNGWDCESKDNPITKCIYVPFDVIPVEECCIFCGEPEERK